MLARLFHRHRQVLYIAPSATPGADLPDLEIRCADSRCALVLRAWRAVPPMSRERAR